MGRSVALTAVLLLSAQSAAAEPIRQPFDSPRPPLEAQLLADGLDGRLDDVSLLRAALIASGDHHPPSLDRYARIVDGWQSQLLAEAAGDSLRDRAAAIHAFLHREVFRGRYDAACHDLTAAFDEGRYNCITATLLFCVLAERLDLACQAEHLPGHVRLQVGEKSPLVVETTCRPWFSLTADAQQARTLPGTARPLTAVELIAKLYYNRGVAAAQARRYAEAAQAFSDSHKLDPHDAAACQNLLAALNNGALALCDAGDFASAWQWLDQAASFDAGYPLLAANEAHVQQRWMAALCERGQFAEALAIVAESKQRHPEAPLSVAGPAAVYRLWAEDLLRRGQRHAALAKVEQALQLDPHNQPLLDLRQQLLLGPR